MKRYSAKDAVVNPHGSLIRLSDYYRQLYVVRDVIVEALLENEEVLSDGYAKRLGGKKKVTPTLNALAEAIVKEAISRTSITTDGPGT